MKDLLKKSFWSRIESIVRDLTGECPGDEGFSQRSKESLKKNLLSFEFDSAEFQKLLKDPQLGIVPSHIKFASQAYTLYKGDTFFIDINFWPRKVTTNYHNHDFEGAFACLKGRFVHASASKLRSIEKEENLLEFLELNPVKRKVMKKTDIIEIKRGDAFVHRLTYLEPCVNLVVRTYNASIIQTFFPPHISFTALCFLPSYLKKIDEMIEKKETEKLNDHLLKQSVYMNCSLLLMKPKIHPYFLEVAKQLPEPISDLIIKSLEEFRQECARDFALLHF